MTDAALPDAKRPRSANPFATLSVFSYRTPVATLFVPHGKPAEATTHAVLKCLFGPRTHNMFSCTVSSEGRFFAFDEGLLEHFGATRASRDLWHCLYIHEASPDCRGDNASQSCWFRAFAGGSCRRAAEPCCPAPPGAKTCYHGRGWHPRNFRNVPRGETTVGRLTSAAVRKSTSRRRRGGRRHERNNTQARGRPLLERRRRLRGVLAAAAGARAGAARGVRVHGIGQGAAVRNQRER